MAENKFRFTNEKCPVCESAFQPEDDIVVCPYCGTPHHRECYKQNGKCKNSDLHESGYRWEPSFKEEEHTQPKEDFKPNTNNEQNKNQSDNPFTNFESPFPPPSPNNPIHLFPKELEDGVSTLDVASFVQFDALKYIQKFFYIKGGKRTINWAALFFAPYWFFYRKMHKLGVIFMAILLGLSFISFLPPVQRLNEANLEYMEQFENLSNSSASDEEIQATLTELSQEVLNAYKQNYLGVGLMAFQSIATIAVNIFIALNANKWYYKHVVTEIQKINEKNLDEKERSLLIYKTGKASYGIAFLSVLVEKIFIFGFELILMMLLH